MTTPFSIDARGPGGGNAARLDANWWAIEAELDAPRPRRAERALQAVGVPAHITRVVGATPALRRSWFVATFLVVVIGLGAADPALPRSSLFTLLVAAPLLPVAGVALAFGAAADPLHEMQLAAPVNGLRLVAWRALTVCLCAAAAVALPAALSDVARPMVAAWMLPAAAVTSTTVALMTAMPPRRAGAVASALWVLVAVVARVSTRDVLAVFLPTGQLIALVATVAAGAVAVTRRRAFERLELQ